MKINYFCLYLYDFLRLRKPPRIFDVSENSAKVSLQESMEALPVTELERYFGSGKIYVRKLVKNPYKINKVLTQFLRLDLQKYVLFLKDKAHTLLS